MELGCAVPVMLSEYAILWLCVKVLQVFFNFFSRKKLGFFFCAAEPAEFLGLLACFTLVVWLLCFVALNFLVWCHDSFIFLLLCVLMHACMLYILNMTHSLTHTPTHSTAHYTHAHDSAMRSQASCSHSSEQYMQMTHV